jgi:hypothetical protein
LSIYSIDILRILFINTKRNFTKNSKILNV